MKRGWKIFLVTDLIILLLGILISFFGWMVGDRPDDAAWNRWSSRIADRIADHEYTINVGNSLDGIEFDAIDISCKAGDLDICGDEDGYSSVTAEGLNTGLKVVEKDGISVLVSENNNLSFGDIQIRISNEKKLKYVKISIGSGDLDMSDVETEDLDIKVSAGDADLYNVTANDLNLKCSLGDIEYEHTYLSYDDFNYNLDCTMGNIELNGVEYSGFSFNKNIQNNAKRNINISCGAGNIAMVLDDDYFHH